jgi:O-methyltransferase involved in polyketide biosynthesis
MTVKQGDLSVTALYTSQVWTWGGLPYAHLFAHSDAKRVFDATNATLAAARIFNRRLAPLRYSLLHRHAMIDHLLRESGYRRVVELAAGFSQRGTAATSDPNMHYIEIDLPYVIERKREFLHRTDEGRAVLAPPGLRLAGADVETVTLDDFVQRGEPVFVIAEGLLMYLATDARPDLFTKVRQLATTTGQLRFMFDLTPTEEPEGRIVRAVLSAAMKRGTGGRTFERDAGTRDDIMTALREAGFDDSAAVTARDVAHAWNLLHSHRRTQVMLFVASAAGACRRTHTSFNLAAAPPPLPVIRKDTVDAC